MGMRVLAPSLLLTAFCYSVRAEQEQQRFLAGVDIQALTTNSSFLLGETSGTLQDGSGTTYTYSVNPNFRTLAEGVPGDLFLVTETGTQFTVTFSAPVDLAFFKTEGGNNGVTPRNFGIRGAGVGGITELDVTGTPAEWSYIAGTTGPDPVDLTSVGGGTTVFGEGTQSSGINLNLTDPGIDSPARSFDDWGVFTASGVTSFTYTAIQFLATEGFRLAACVTAPTSAPTASPTVAPVLPGTSAPTRSPTPGGAMGDPHIKRWDGVKFQYHSECDLVLASSPGFSNGLGLHVHIRTTIVDDWSYISSAAIKIGPDVLEVTKAGKYWINGQKEVALPASFSGHEINYGRTTTATKEKLPRFHKFSIDLGNGQSIIVKSFRARELLAVMIDGTRDEDFTDSVGLMGSFPDGVMLTRDGKRTLSAKPGEVNVFGQEWQVSGSDPRLFRNLRSPQWPEQQCVLPLDLPVDPAVAAKRRRLSETVTRDHAELACADWDVDDFDSCVQDVLATGDLGLAEAGSY